MTSTQHTIRLLEAITRAQSCYLADHDAQSALDCLLRDCRQLTESPHGFIAQVLTGPNGNPCLDVLALEAGSAQEETGKLRFANLNNLLGVPMGTGQPLIAREVPLDPRSGGLPPNHLPLDTFLGIPIKVEQRVVAILALANRAESYDDNLVAFLHPLLTCAGQLVLAWQRNEENRQRLQNFQASAEKFHHILEHAPLAIVFQRLDGSFLEASKVLLETLGYPREHLLKLSSWQITPSEYHPRDQEYLDHLALAGHDEPFCKEFLHRDGQRIPVKQEGRILCPTAGERLVCTVIHDLSRQKEEETVLSQNTLRLARMLRGGNDGAWDYDIRKNTFFFSERWREVLGYAPGDAGITWQTLLHPEDLERAEKIYQNALTGQASTCEAIFRLRHKNGRYVPMLARGEIQRDEQGQPIWLSGTNQDLSEQQRLEEALKNSEAYLRTILDSLPIHVAVLSAEGLVTATNRAWEQFGASYPVDRGLGNRIPVGHNYLAACRRGLSDPNGVETEAALTGIQAVLEELAPHFQLEYCQPSGNTLHWFSLHIAPLQAVGGGVVVAHENISQRKRAEQALRENEQRFRELFEQAPTAYLSLDQKGRFLDANRELCGLLGYYREELLGKNLEQFSPPERPLDLRKILATFTLESSCPRKLELLHRDGRTLTLLLKGRAQQDSRENFLCFHCALVDISHLLGLETDLHGPQTGP